MVMFLALRVISRKALGMQCLQSNKQNFNMFVTREAACRAEENNFQQLL
jgi:hypothetical protein